MLISVIIPTHNRPALLREALCSVAQQTYADFEVVVMDDGSLPPVPPAMLKDILGTRVLLQRHNHAQGIPKAKNAGIRAAHGDVILLLDDDDLLTANALQEVCLAFNNYPQIDCLFLGASPFGPYADGPAKNRLSALTRLIQQTTPEERDGLYLFGDTLFEALLQTVPIDLQRPAAPRSVWNIVGEFDENSLFSEANWTIRASTVCKLALIKNPLTQWRIHGDNFGWPSNLGTETILRRNLDNELLSSQQLLEVFKKKKRLLRRQTQSIQVRYANQHFIKAYRYRNNARYEGLRSLVKSFRISPSFRHVRLALSYLIPPSWLGNR